MDDELTTPGASDADDSYTDDAEAFAGLGDDADDGDAVTASTDRGDEGAADDDDAQTATTAAKARPAQAKAPESVDDLPPWAQKIIREARQGEGDFRKRTKAAEEKAANTEAKLQGFLDGFAKVLGLTSDDDGAKAEPPDPEKLTAQLSEAQREHRATQVELAVYRAAGYFDGDAEALLDSRSFLNRVVKLDPNADDFHENVGAAIAEAIEANPKLRVAAPAAPTAPIPTPPSGGEFSGGPAGRTDAESLTVDDFRKRRRERRGQ